MISLQERVVDFFRCCDGDLRWQFAFGLFVAEHELRWPDGADGAVLAIVLGRVESLDDLLGGEAVQTVAGEVSTSTGDRHGP